MTCEIRAARLLGLPAVMGARVLGRVEKAVPEASGKALKGLLIRRGLGSARWISRESVGVLGDVSVVVRRTPVRPPRDPARALSVVKDEGGLTLGRVTDMWLDPESFAITALEITLGPLEDLRCGRLCVRHWTVQPGDDGIPQVLLNRSEWEVQQ